MRQTGSISVGMSLDSTASFHGLISDSQRWSVVDASVKPNVTLRCREFVQFANADTYSIRVNCVGWTLSISSTPPSRYVSAAEGSGINR